jgi:hypothetical protein
MNQRWIFEPANDDNAEFVLPPIPPAGPLIYRDWIEAHKGISDGIYTIRNRETGMRSFEPPRSQLHADFHF